MNFLMYVSLVLAGNIVVLLWNSDLFDSNRAKQVNSLTPTMTLLPIKLIAGRIPLHRE